MGGLCTGRTCPQYSDGSYQGTCKTDLQGVDYWEWTDTLQCVPKPIASFGYYPSDVKTPINEKMTDVTPTIAGAYVEYMLVGKIHGEVPVLPDGIVFSTATGIFSGTPTKEVEKATYNVKAANGVNDMTATVSFTVQVNAGNKSIAVWIVILVVIIVLFILTCLFIRVRGTGRAKIGNRKTLKGSTAQKAKSGKTTSRV